MKLNVLFSAPSRRWREFCPLLLEAFERTGLSVDLRTELDPKLVDYVIYAPNNSVTDFTPFTRLKAVLGLWAGVESIVGNASLSVPLTRMVDNGLSEAMVEWVTAHVLRHHIGFDARLAAQNGVWAPVIPPLARERRVGILGLGELGSRCATTLASLHFNVSGWSRSKKHIPGTNCLNGDDGLSAVLASSEILVLLLPVTAATENILNAERIAKLPRGAIIINPGRGALIDDSALLAALDTRHIAHATLDVFRTEPLPANDPYWSHPNVTVTPHVASETRAASASKIIAENMRRDQNSEPLLFLVNREAGY